ncbi:MAG: periplasmic heavy metal sensor [Acidobacteria bacterium]|nr:MAG: periplasmic heavy metal sensor [Acidobacteriota bacterium]
MRSSTNTRNGHSGLLRPLVAAAVGLAAIAAAFGAAPARGRELGQRWWKNPEAVERLGLTPEQVEQIDRVAYEAADRMIELRAAREKARMALMRLLEKEELDDAAIADAIEKVEKAECELASVQLRARVDIARLLTPEQRSMVRRRFERARRQADRDRPASRHDR